MEKKKKKQRQTLVAGVKTNVTRSVSEITGELEPIYVARVDTLGTNERSVFYVGFVEGSQTIYFWEGTKKQRNVRYLEYSTI